MATTGDWLARREADREGAWKILVDLLRELSPGVAARTGAPLPFVREDASQEALTDLVADDAPLLRVDRSVPLRSFLWGYFKNVTYRLLEATPRTVSLPNEVPARTAAPDRGKLQLDMLTPPQRDAVLGLREGKSLAELARILGISRAAVRERLARAWSRIRALRRATAGTQQRSRQRRQVAWVLAACRENLERKNLENADLLLLHATGASRGEISSRRGLSRNAVKCRLRRMRLRHEESRQEVP